MERHALVLYGCASLAAAMGWLGGTAEAAASAPPLCVRATSVEAQTSNAGWRRTAAKLMPEVGFRLTGDSAGLANRSQTGTHRRAIRLDAVDSARTSTRHWELIVNWNPLRIFGLLDDPPEQIESTSVVCLSGTSLARDLIDPADSADVNRDDLAEAIRQAHRRALREALEEE